MTAIILYVPVKILYATKFKHRHYRTRRKTAWSGAVSIAFGILVVRLE